MAAGLAGACWRPAESVLLRRRDAAALAAGLSALPLRPGGVPAAAAVALWLSGRRRTSPLRLRAAGPATGSRSLQGGGGGAGRGGGCKGVMGQEKGGVNTRCHQVNFGGWEIVEANQQTAGPAMVAASFLGGCVLQSLWRVWSKAGPVTCCRHIRWQQLPSDVVYETYLHGGHCSLSCSRAQYRAKTHDLFPHTTVPHLRDRHPPCHPGPHLTTQMLCRSRRLQLLTLLSGIGVEGPPTRLGAGLAPPTPADVGRGTPPPRNTPLLLLLAPAAKDLRSEVAPASLLGVAALLLLLLPGELGGARERRLLLADRTALAARAAAASSTWAARLSSTSNS